MIAVDTNILVYAHRTDSPWHQTAAGALRELDARGSRWAIPWPCLYEFYNIVSHPKIFRDPTPPDVALETIRGWLDSTWLHLLAEDGDYGGRMLAWLDGASILGPKIHDARIAMLCAYHGVTELWSVDRDFSRFAFLKTRNPLV
jgi:toxin-antitoxin system PIN domain toxin